ncbi:MULTISPECIES: hypothetical protein [unclassified Hyphomicrobium]|uniref:hypothetical protein n=1 Tax=unclassified Hyphomicrobium TaxID=2619925 RepID=UPI000213D367|nr:MULTISPECIES: hypothetical protein [unclassified Hyphomicrobium]CCB65612.1 protein of unknown function [Hyphomicrobium sp. MC1]
MNSLELKDWFLQQTDQSRVAYVLRLIHAMTVDFRGAESTQQSEAIIGVAKKANELTRHLTSYAAAVLESGPHLPDETFIEGLSALIEDPGTQSIVPYMAAEALRLPRSKLS